MKQLLLFSLAFILILASCSKDQRNNRRIDGEWHATIFMGEDPEVFNEAYYFTFNHDKKGEGTGTVEWVDGSFSEVYGMKYFLKNDYLSMIIDGESLIFTIKSLSRKKIELTDAEGEATVLEKH
jgi:hypothetical protein